MVIHSWGLRSYQVAMDPKDGMEVAYAVRAKSFMGPLNRDLISLEDVLKESQIPRKKIDDFEIITSYQWSDVLLSLIPFFSTRTVEVRGKIWAQRSDWYE